MSNALSRLTLLHINIAGAVAAGIVALILFFGLVRPKQEQVTQIQAETAGNQSNGGTPDKVEEHKRLLATTQKQAKDTEAAWQVNSARYMPNLNFGTTKDLLLTYENSIITLPEKWGKWVSGWYDAQRDDGISRLPGVEFPIAGFPTDPNAISTLTHLTFPEDNRPWPVSVEAKTFNAAMAHLERFNSMGKHGMPVVDNVSLSGESPNLVMSYTLALYIIPNTPPPSADVMLGGAAATTTTGAGMPGMGGMMGGSMPGMMGGSMPGMMGPAGAAGGPAVGGAAGVAGGKSAKE